jgi:hypothetical protein
MSTSVTSQPPITQLSFGSVFRYYPTRMLSEDEKRGRKSTAPAHSYQLMQKVKSCDVSVIDYLSRRVEQAFVGYPALSSLFTGKRIVLVPVPRSSPMKSPSSSWPALWICKEILEHVISKMHVTPRLAVLLKRTSPVPPARTGKKDERRPSIHYATMAVDQSQLERHFHKIKAGDVVVLVDDIVTSGNTIMASAWHVKSCLPSVEVRAFTLFRTLQIPDPDVLFEPVVGTIEYDVSMDWCNRNP